MRGSSGRGGIFAGLPAGLRLRIFFGLALACALVLVPPPASAARGYALATAHPLATRAGEHVLKEGGNAFDAAVAVSAVLAVVEPYSSGFGGGGFWLLHEAASGRDVMVDGRETAPSAASAGMYLDRDGKVIADLSVNGALAAGIPGMPAAIAHIAKRYGSLPLARLLAPAIHYAEGGFAADARFERFARLRLDALKASAEASAVFLSKGQPPPPGAIIRQPGLAATLRRMAVHGGDEFYRGRTAHGMVAAVTRAGGIWRMKDLEAYAVVERRPVRFKYKNVSIVSASPPSSGGIVLAQIFNILAQFRLDEMSPLQRTHHTIEAMRRAYRDRSIWLGDPGFTEIPRRLTSTGYAAVLARGIDPNRATPSAALEPEPQSEGRDTTHFSIIDAAGNRVAATLSVNYPFGCGLVAGATGVLLNNEMDDFAAAPGVANLYGLTGGAANAIAPGKRMLSSMSPTFADDGKRVAVLGTPGGSRIITMVMAAIMKFIDGGTAAEIVSMPRVHHQYLPDEIVFEAHALDTGTARQLQSMGHRLAEAGRAYGNMQIVIRDHRSGALDAASDPRGGGSALNSRTTARRQPNENNGAPPE